jgi:hypothetical protein
MEDNTRIRNVNNISSSSLRVGCATELFAASVRFARPIKKFGPDFFPAVVRVTGLWYLPFHFRF